MAETVILDACCTLNLVASGHVEEILQQLPYRFCTGRRGMGEAQYLAISDSKERELIDLRPLLDRGLVATEELAQPAEAALFVALGVKLADGEAVAAALAISRGYILATDDRKARRIAVERHADLRLLGTLELLREWQQIAGPPQAVLRQAVHRISQRATYRPRKSHPLWSWWESLYTTPDAPPGG